MKFKRGDLVYVDFEGVIGKGVVLGFPLNTGYEYTIDFSDYLSELKRGSERLHPCGSQKDSCYWVNESGITLAEYNDDLDNWV